MCRMAYQWVCMRLGKHLTYQMKSVYKKDVIELAIIPKPNLTPQQKASAYPLCKELIAAVMNFIKVLTRQHTPATCDEYPVRAYVPCPQCSDDQQLHITVEDAAESNLVYCPTETDFVDITPYHEMLG